MVPNNYQRLEKQLREKYHQVLPYLNERQKRLITAADAISIGYKGVSIVSRVSGLSRPTIYQGIKELDENYKNANRIRKLGGGRKKVSEKTPELVAEIEKIVAPNSRGDPKSPLQWTCKSTRNISKVLSEKGYKISHTAVADILHELDYSLQGNAKVLEGSHNPDREAQFQYINKIVSRYLSKKEPVISVDSKKRELVGNYKNNGREWHPKGNPEKVNIHDFPDEELGKAIPYGIYDIGDNSAWVNVGCDHDTAAFAVESIRRWWKYMGVELYPTVDKLLICADGGGSNGYRIKLWKVELQKFADDIKLEITVCHFPPGTSKWNKIEHRLFSQITLNWRGKPLTSYETIVNLIGNVKNDKGLKVKSTLDLGKYPTKIKISNKEMKKLHLEPHKFHGEWNYTIKPRQ